MSDLLILFLVILLDYRIGDPKGWPHPIIAIGWLIKKVEILIRQLRLNNRFGGAVLWLVTVVLVVFTLSLTLWAASLLHPVAEQILIIYFLFASMAATSLKKEASKVASALLAGDIVEGRKYLSWLVGRDTATLTEEEVIKGAVETVAENTIDGVLAPLFYIIVGFIIGYPVQMVFIYKTVNTLDSMLGYIQMPYTHIGYVSAKMDDLFNYIPARIGSFIMLLAGGVLSMDQHNARYIWKRDCRKHKSPNAGYPESVVAGLLNIQLGGTHTYFGEVLDKPSIGDDIRTVKVTDIEVTCRIMYMSEFIMLMTGVALLYLLS